MLANASTVLCTAEQRRVFETPIVTTYRGVTMLLR